MYIYILLSDDRKFELSFLGYNIFYREDSSFLLIYEDF